MKQPLTLLLSIVLPDEDGETLALAVLRVLRAWEKDHPEAFVSCGLRTATMFSTQNMAAIIHACLNEDDAGEE
jgi:hypothetical protein